MIKRRDFVKLLGLSALAPSVLASIDFNPSIAVRPHALYIPKELRFQAERILGGSEARLLQEGINALADIEYTGL